MLCVCVCVKCQRERRETDREKGQSASALQYTRTSDQYTQVQFSSCCCEFVILICRTTCLFHFFFILYFKLSLDPEREVIQVSVVVQRCRRPRGRSKLREPAAARPKQLFSEQQLDKTDPQRLTDLGDEEDVQNMFALCFGYQFSNMCACSSFVNRLIQSTESNSLR